MFLLQIWHKLNLFTHIAFSCFSAIYIFSEQPILFSATSIVSHTYSAFMFTVIQFHVLDQDLLFFLPVVAFLCNKSNICLTVLCLSAILIVLPAWLLLPSGILLALAHLCKNPLSQLRMWSFNRFSAKPFFSAWSVKMSKNLSPLMFKSFWSRLFFLIPSWLISVSNSCSEAYSQSVGSCVLCSESQLIHLRCGWLCFYPLFW